MNSEKQCCCCCGEERKHFNQKNAFVEKFIQQLKETPITINVSSRQIAIYGRLIKNLEDAPRTITMKDVRLRFIQTEDDMYCPCCEEKDCNGYVTIFDGLWYQLRLLLRQELEFLCPCECKKEEVEEDDGLYCWEYNEHFCERSKKYYEGMVDLNYMDCTYNWTKTATNAVKACWIDHFGEAMDVRGRWSWAKQVWNMANKLNKRDYDSLSYRNQKKLQKIKNLFTAAK